MSWNCDRRPSHKIIKCAPKLIETTDADKALYILANAGLSVLKPYQSDVIISSGVGFGG